MSKACYKINHGNFYPESDCPYCEIDRLNKEINRLRQYEDAITSAIDGTLLVWNLMSTNHTVIKNDYWQNHLEEIEWLKAELELSNDETMQESNKVVDLERQLAEARAEVDRLKEEIHHYEDQGLWMPDKEDLVRKRAAREIIQYIVDQGVIDAGTIARPMLVYEIAECDIAELKMRFGLEV